jgi:thioredoxin-like negative regulator of GroEL
VPVLVEFWAPWCAPCRRLEQPLADLARDLGGRLRVVRVNVDTSPRSARLYRVELLPTLVLFASGEELDRITGVPASGELRDRLANVLRPAAGAPGGAGAAR